MWARTESGFGEQNWLRPCPRAVRLLQHLGFRGPLVPVGSPFCTSQAGCPGEPPPGRPGSANTFSPHFSPPRV